MTTATLPMLPSGRRHGASVSEWMSAVVARASEGREHRRHDATDLERFATRHDLLTFRATELRAAQEARAVVEARYLAGHAALFPDAVKAWAAQPTSTETLADLACRVAGLDGVPPAEPADPEAASAHVTELVADLVEPAKATALEKLGEGEQALGIAIRWLRARMMPSEATLKASGRRGPRMHVIVDDVAVRRRRPDRSCEAH